MTQAQLSAQQSHLMCRPLCIVSWRSTHRRSHRVRVHSWAQGYLRVRVDCTSSESLGVVRVVASIGTTTGREHGFARSARRSRERLHRSSRPDQKLARLHAANSNTENPAWAGRVNVIDFFFLPSYFVDSSESWIDRHRTGPEESPRSEGMLLMDRLSKITRHTPPGCRQSTLPRLIGSLLLDR